MNLGMKVSPSSGAAFSFVRKRNPFKRRLKAKEVFIKNLAVNPLNVSVEGLKRSDLFTQQAKKTVREISDHIGEWETTRIHLAPLSKKKEVFVLSLCTQVNGKPVVVKQKGRRVFSLLQKAKRVALRIARRSKEKSIRSRKAKNHPQPSPSPWKPVLESDPLK